MDITNLYLGQGITFPFVLSDGTITIDQFDKVIETSIRTILGWEFGSRFFAETATQRHSS